MNSQTALVKHAVFLQRDLQPLELGQIGMSSDECRVFVGLPSTEVAASLVAGRTSKNVPGSGGENVEVLTEFTPPMVLSRALNRPIVINVGYGTNKFYILSASRVFLDYMAYPTIDLYTGTNLSNEFESGSVNIMSMGETTTTLYTQTNNTNNESGVPRLKFHQPVFDKLTGRMEFSIVNSSPEKYKYTVELLVRCWNGDVV